MEGKGKIRFKSYIGPAMDGSPVLYDCSDYTEADLIQMLAQPKHLTPISFQAAHQLWGDIFMDLLEDGDIKEAGRLSNMGMARRIAEFGFRIVPLAYELE